MVEQTHTLRLQIDAAAAEVGSKRFLAATNAVRKAVQDLDREADGTFSKLARHKPQFDVSPLTRATTEAQKLNSALASNIQRTALASASATRMAEQAAQRLAIRLADIGDVQGLARLNVALAQMKGNLVNATSTLDVRSAKSGFDDVRSSLLQATVASEHLRGEQAQLARELAEAQRAAATQAATLDSLRAKYNPLYAASKQYESALEEISMAEREGAISSQLAAAARDQAAASLAGNTTAMNGFTVSAGQARAATQQMGFQLNDILTMASLGASPFQVLSSQIFQVTQAMEMAGGGAKAMGTVKSAIMGLLNPTTLVVGAVIGLTTALVQWGISALGAGEDTKSFSDALSDTEGHIRAVSQATGALAGDNLKRLRQEYNLTNAELLIHLDRLREVARLGAMNTNADMAAAIRDSITSDGNMFTGDADAVRRAFDTTNDAARQYLYMLEQIKAARTFEDQVAAITKLRQQVESATGGLGKAEGEARNMLIQLIQAEDAALRLQAAADGTAGAANNGAGAASNLAYTIGTAADEAARLLANLNSVPSALAVMGKSVEGQIASIQAQNRSLSIQLSSGLSAAAADRRVQLETMISTAGERGQVITPDAIAAEWGRINELEAAAKEQDRLRAELTERNRPARQARSGGGRGSPTADLTEEQKAMEELNKTLTDRLNGLEAERITLALVASGTFKTTEAAELFAQAMIQGGGAVDAQTAAMIRQIDVAAKLNEELTRAARDPVKEWMDSVPNWLEAGKQIEMGAIESLKSSISEFIKTGKFDINSLGEAILGTIADIVADKAVKELMTLLGRGDQSATGGFAGMLAGLFSSRGDTDVSALATQAGPAGQTIAGILMQQAPSIGAAIASGMSGVGPQIATSAQSGLTAGSASVRAAGQQGLAIGSAQMTAAGSTAGTTINQAMVAGGQSAATSIGMSMGSGSAGGGLLSGMGGIGGLVSMVLPGLFSEGGYSTSPVASAAVPASLFHNAPHYAEGTANTSSTGRPAILHDSEAVIPLSRGRAVNVELTGNTGGQVINMPQTFNIQTNDASSFRKSQKQIAADMASAGQRAVRDIR